MRYATFVLSTGRCGTQWLTDALTAVCGNTVRIEHEPLHNDYSPRQMLGAADPSAASGRSARRMTEHAEAIDRELETRDYIETGHPCWGALPWLVRRFAGHVRVIHLVRHPVPVACSWLSHRAFVPSPLPMVPMRELIAPTDSGVAFPEYCEIWPNLSAYEKCLYYWAEVNALGLRLQGSMQVPWLRVSYEALFDSAAPALEQLFSFIGASNTAATAINRSAQVDGHRFAVDCWPEVESISRHPRIVDVVLKFGYDPAKIDRAGLRARFMAAP